MSAAVQLVTESLQQAADAEPDIYAVAFERYFQLCPESRELLQHTDDLMRGRMMEQVMSLLMDEDAQSLDNYFRFEVGNHESYGALPHMYVHLFQACREVVEEVVQEAVKHNSADGFSQEMARAWEEQIGVLLAMIKRYSQPD